jgi:hypothetical protein
MSSIPRSLLRIRYEESAETYLRSLPLEHFMESTSQSQQRKITLVCFDLVSAERPEVQMFSELLLQYPGPDDTICRVVPDNMVILYDQPIKAKGSYDLPLQPVGPFMILEYVSKYTKRKDYEDNLQKYEQELKVPYYLLFYPDAEELTLYRLKGQKYISVKPNRQGRYAIRELDMEVAILDGWVRFWLEGRLLPLPADLQRELDAANSRADEEKRRADEEKRRADEEKRRADEEKRRADEAERELAKLRAELQQRRTP